jgi:hypothetical protein
MSWIDPFTTLVESHVQSTHKEFESRRDQLNCLIKASDAFFDATNKEGNEKVDAWRALQRGVRDISWRKLVMTTHWTRTAATLLTKLRATCQQIAAELQSSPEPDPPLAARLTLALLELRSGLDTTEQRDVQVYERLLPWLRWGGPLASLGAIVGPLILTYTAGLQHLRDRPVLPMQSVDESDLESIQKAQIKAVREVMSKGVPLPALPASLTEPPAEPGGPRKGNELSMPGLFADDRVDRILSGVWEFEFINASYLRSEYIGIVECWMELIEEKPFPWQDIFIDFNIDIGCFQENNTVWLVNHSNSPVLVTGGVYRQGHLTLPLVNTVMQAREEINLTSLPVAASIGEGPVEVRPAPVPPAESAQLAPPPSIVSSQSQALTPIQASGPPADAQLPANKIEAKLRIETIDGRILDRSISIEQRVPRSYPCAPAAIAPISGAIAAALGKQEKFGVETLHAATSIDINDISESERRRVVIPINKFLLPRGVLSVRAGFVPKVSGTYRIVTCVNGYIREVARLQLLGCDIRWQCGKLSLESFRSIQQELNVSPGEKK